MKSTAVKLPPPKDWARVHERWAPRDAAEAHDMARRLQAAGYRLGAIALVCGMRAQEVAATTFELTS